MTVTFGAVLGLLVQGYRLDAKLSEKLMMLVKGGQLTFYAVTRDNLQPPHPGTPIRLLQSVSPHRMLYALLTPSYMATTSGS